MHWECCSLGLRAWGAGPDTPFTSSEIFVTVPYEALPAGTGAALRPNAKASFDHRGLGSLRHPAREPGRSWRGWSAATLAQRRRGEDAKLALRLAGYAGYSPDTMYSICSK